MAIRFLKTPEASVPAVSGPSLFVDTDGTPKLKLEDGDVAELLPVTATKVVLSTGEPVVVEDATALFGKDYDGVAELAVQRGSGPVTRITQGAGLVGGASSYFTPGAQQTADISVIIPAAPTHVVTGTADIGGLIEITTSAPHGMSTGAPVDISGVLGTVAANGSWTITVTGASTFTLDGSVYDFAYGGGGLVQEVLVVNPVLLTGITLALPAGWCAYQCHLEFILLNENYQSQTSPPDYNDMRGLGISGDFALLFDAGVGTPDTRHANAGPNALVAITVPLRGDPVEPPFVFPASSDLIVVSSGGDLTLNMWNSGPQKYWFAGRCTVSPPITVPGP